VKLPEKIKIFRKFGQKNRFFVKLPEKIKIFRKFSYKIEIFYPDPRLPQISNQIDAAVRWCKFSKH